MKTVLVIGGGGREHALAVAFARSERVERVLVAPGNGGTAADPTGKVQNGPVGAEDVEGLLALAASEDVDLTFVGPEVPLALGIADRFAEAGRRLVGPSAAAARIEASKAFAKDFMARHGLPCAKSQTFDDLGAAKRYVEATWGPLVLKASGLAAGKGVLLPDTLDEALAGLESLMAGEAGAEVVIEERLTGEEVSLLGFCDGKTARAMPPGRDHKRVGEGDVGPNTGGMGAFAPTRALSAEALEELEQTVLQAAVAGMAEDGSPYVGVLYAGLMLTPDGPKLLEYNCRFGDPETQVLLPLLETDLLDVAEAMVDGTLADLDLRWTDGAAATVILASEGYPGSYPKGRVIDGTEEAGSLDGVTVYHAGTRRTEEALVTSGGRVLAVTGVGEDLDTALLRAYAGVERIHFEGRQLRRDIGHTR